MIALIAAFFAVAIALGAFLVGSSARERSAVRRTLRSLEGYETETKGLRDQEMVGTLTERVLAPVGKSAIHLARRATPIGYADTVKRKIVIAGNPPGYEVDRVLVLKVLGAASGVLWIPLIYFVLGLTGMMALLATGFLWVVSFLGPDLTLGRKIEWRQHEIAVHLPDMLDLLVISVEAGLGFEQAVDRTASAVPGPLADEFRRMLQETRIGATRADALRALDERTQVQDLRSFILAMLQADAFGVSVARILRSQADEMRIRRRQAAEEQAQAAPIKMLFPLVFCIFPAVFVVVLGPALISINDAL